MKRLNYLRSPAFIFLHDLAMIPAAWLGAYWIRYNLDAIPPEHWTAAWFTLPWVMFAQGLAFRYFRLYLSVWRFVSLPDLIQIGKAIASGSIAVTLGLFFYDSFTSVPRSVPLTYSMLLLILIGGPRFFFRAWKDRTTASSQGLRALIVGAGKAAEMLIRDLLQEKHPEYRPVVLVDDDRRKKGREIHGIRIAGNCRKIPRLVKKHHIDTVLIAIPSADEKQMRRIVELCEQSNAPFLTLPSLKELLHDQVSTHELRDVSIEDLLEREAASLDWELIRARLQDKVVMVTGGGGSIGSELCQQLARLPISKLVVFESCEYNLYRVDRILRQKFPDLELVPFLGSTTDAAAVQHLIAEVKPQVVFHAAAYKHVPLLEKQAREAILNNIIGTHTVARAAIANQVEEFVLISTDKAVNPSNVMGASKRAAEMISQSLNHAGVTRFITVRFGNVLDSAGSVVPLFREQIQAGGPVTVTDPEVSRYFMTIPEACLLILQAAAAGRGGEIFMLDMGEPVKIRYLAEQMIRLSGKRPGVDIKIDYIGLRPGEKIKEELFHEQENLTTTPHNKLLLAHSRTCDRKIIEKLVQKIKVACEQYDEAQAIALLQTLVPEYDQGTKRISKPRKAPQEKHNQVHQLFTG